MKKIITLTALLLAVCCLLASCKETEQQGQQNDLPAEEQTSGEPAQENGMPTVLNSTEYVLYQNIFYNDQGGDYVGSQISKTGTFTVLYDEFNEMTRYYVWGYNDATKCCDWQWEFVPADPSSLPEKGSLVEMTGEFAADEKALDGYWFINATVTVKQAYKRGDYDLDLTSMSGTLERVQIINMQQFSDKFEGKTVSMYGRILNPTTIQHPYYDSAFEQTFAGAQASPAIGTVVIARGVYRGGTVSDCVLTATGEY